jgi:hypothetical protein
MLKETKKYLKSVLPHKTASLDMTNVILIVFIKMTVCFAFLHCPINSTSRNVTTLLALHFKENCTAVLKIVF